MMHTVPVLRAAAIAAMLIGNFAVCFAQTQPPKAVPPPPTAHPPPNIDPGIKVTPKSSAHFPTPVIQPPVEKGDTVVVPK